MFGNKLPPKLQAKLDAKAMRKFEAAQAGERPKGLSGIFSRVSMPAKAMELPSQARAKMPTGMRDAGMGAPIMGGDVDAMMGRISQRDKPGMKKGGKVKKMAKGGSTASKRADGCATKGKTKGRFV